MSYDAPFRGLKVIDLSQGVAGPYCAMLLAQYGADVIKVEPLADGDWSRTLGKRYGQHTAYSIPANLGKRSIALDLKERAGKDVLWRLIVGADVLIEGFRPGVLARLGFSYEAVAEIEPRLLYLSVSGFGQTGPLTGRPAMDPVLQAFTGLSVDNKGEDGIPHRVPFIVVDMSTALYAFQALSAALYARRDEQRGRRIEASLMQTAGAMQVIRLNQSLLEGEQTKRSMPSGVFKSADGWLQILVIKNQHWVALCDVMETPDMATDPRYVDSDARAHNEIELMTWVRATIAAKPTAYWMERLQKADIMHERLNDFREFVAHPQVAATELISWLHVPGVPEPLAVPNLAGMPLLVDGTARATSPVLGQHTRAILAEHGFAETEIDQLLESRVIAAVQR